MKKITTVMVITVIALFGISGTAFAKHHHRHHKNNTDAARSDNAIKTTGSTAASVTGPPGATSKTN